MMETKKSYPRKKALLIAIPLGLLAGVITNLLASWSVGNYPPEGWADLTLGLIIGVGMARAYYHNLVSGKYAK